MRFKFRTLVNQHAKHVYSLALHMLGRPEEAEDIAQEVYLRLWKNINQLDMENAKPWLLKVTRNICIDHIRARKQEVDAEQFEFACDNNRYQPAKALANSDLSKWLTHAISAMKEPYKSLIVMSDVQFKSQKEMANILELSVNQVKVYLHRARQQLRDRLKEIE
ncbi:RNA polymerase sigma factor [Agarilytica rhodophyticola]|uniref:RNA polymerase sigma factor n=1 Tax=Agarilytica rhodophyticola TaxID=1737490 RepID=UPI00131A02EC|nr:sigma-70 family RNA polymerase sigma factor [Agarilytica rhodophyticola]